jgi:hypothetical protein
MNLIKFIMNDFLGFSRGCATSEDMLWKLDALQCFIRDLHWVCSKYFGILILIIKSIFLAG